MAQALKDIRIGTMVKANAPTVVDYVKQILPLGFESIQPFFWQTIGDVDVKRLAGNLREAIAGKDVIISSFAMFGNPAGGVGVVSIRLQEFNISLPDRIHR